MWWVPEAKNFFFLSRQNFLKQNIELNKNIIRDMKLLSIFNRKLKLRLGDIVISDNNVYGKTTPCEITRIYDRVSSGGRIKYCRLEFSYYGFSRVINVTYESCQKVEQ